MPAHCSAAATPQAAKQREGKMLSDGTPLSRHLVLGNALLDKHAKIAAATFRPPPCDFDLIRADATRVREVARWIGLATELANHFPAPTSGTGEKPQEFMRDTEAKEGWRRHQTGSAHLRAHRAAHGHC